ncbi:MAG: hypothetical protein ACPGC0_06345, partial [Opitutales bacterium]
MRMETSLRQYALGESLVASPHSVVGCLPTLADVRAYEEKESRVWSALEGGYPRFVEHVWVRKLKEFYMKRAGLEITDAALLRGEPALASLRDLLGGDFHSLEVEAGLFLGWLEGAADSKALMKYIQHTGCGISSREAEDWLVQHGLKASVFEETTYAGDAETAVRSELAGLTGAKSAEIWPCASGMNAFYSAFRAIQSVQRARGRRRWLQLGWLYVD